MRPRWMITLILAVLAAGAAWSVTAARPEPREIVLEARGMAFYLPGDPTPNPTVAVAPGELVRLTLVNLDRGMQHDLAVAGLDVATAVVAGDGSRTSVRLRAPREVGSFDYLCSLHAQSMRGVLEVR